MGCEDRDQLASRYPCSLLWSLNDIAIWDLGSSEQNMIPYFIFLRCFFFCHVTGYNSRMHLEILFNPKAQFIEENSELQVCS